MHTINQVRKATLTFAFVHVIAINIALAEEPAKTGGRGEAATEAYQVTLAAQLPVQANSVQSFNLPFCPIGKRL